MLPSLIYTLTCTCFALVLIWIFFLLEFSFCVCQCLSNHDIVNCVFYKEHLETACGTGFYSQDLPSFDDLCHQADKQHVQKSTTGYII